MALDLGRHGITVNAIAPGRVETGMMPHELLPDSAVPAWRVVRRFDELEDVGRAVAWLVDPTTSFVAGQTIFLDGDHLALGSLAAGTGRFRCQPSDSQ